MCQQRLGLQAIIQLRIAGLIVTALACLLATTPRAMAANAMVAYGVASSSQPRYRLWNDTAWGPEGVANSVGSTPQWLVLRGSPLNERFALATLDNDLNIKVQIWNEYSWSTPFVATTDAGDKTTRVFDMAYEQLSGDLVLVYRENGTSHIRYRRYDGENWSNEANYVMTGGNIRWLELVPKRNSDEMMLIALGEQDNNLSRAALWNGNAFNAQTALPADDDAAAVAYQHADGAFESVSGQGLAAYYQDNIWPGYRTRMGVAWSASLDAPNIGGRLRWCRLASDPASDEILLATFDDKRDLNLTRWSGSAWGVPYQLEKILGTVVCRRMDLAYEPGGNDALVIYDDNTNILRYRTWDGFFWSVEQSGPVGGSQPLWNPQAVTGISGGQIFVAYSTDSGELRSATWNGTAFGPVTILGTASAPKEYESCMIAVATGDPAPPRVVNWQEVQP